VIDLGAVSIGPADGRPPDQRDDDTADVVEALAAAPAVVLATPIYRGSFTGTLKNLLDHVPVPALRDTPVGIISMGASDHHFLGGERHLRDVLAFFGAIVVPTAVYLTSADFDQGRPRGRAEGALDELFDSVIELAERLNGVALGPAPLAAR
jgi:FMN reductase